MKTLFITFFAIFLYLSVQAQQDTLSPIPAIAKTEALIFMVNGLGGPLKTINKNAEWKNIHDSLTFGKSVHPILKQDSILLNTYFKGINQFGQTASSFILWKGLSIQLGSYNNSLTFVQSRVACDFELNSYKLDADQRALYVIKNVILPSLSYFLPLTKDIRFKYFALNAGYRTRDFTDNTPYIAYGEHVSILISKEVLIKYVNAELSDADILKQAIFYMYDKNGNNIRKLSF